MTVRLIYGTEGLEFVWKGGHTVNVYDPTGENIDAFTVGDFARDSATRSEVQAGVERYLTGLREES